MVRGARWLALTVTLQLACQRPCGSTGSPLIFDLASYASLEGVKAQLRPPFRWSNEARNGGLPNATPRFDFITIDIGEGEHLGQRGPTQLTFFNDRLNSVVFSPQHPAGYFEAVARLPGAKVVDQEGVTIVNFEPHTAAWRVGSASPNPPSVEWYDECLREELVSLIQEHGRRGTSPVPR